MFELRQTTHGAGDAAQPGSGLPRVRARVVIASGLCAADRHVLERWAAHERIPFRIDGHDGVGAPGQAPQTDPATLPLLAFMGCGSPGPRAQARVQQLRVPPATIVGVGDRQHIVGAFAAGCDEYLASPLCLQELAVRLARQSPEGPPPAAGAEEPLSLDGRRAELVVRGRRLRLRPSELRLLEYLGRAADRTVTAAEIVQHVLGTHGNGGSARTLIWNLRRRMQKASCDDLLVNVRGHGYRLADGARWFDRTSTAGAAEHPTA